MKQFKEILIGLVVILVFGWLVTYVYRYETSSKNKELAKRIAELSPRGGPPETIDGLRQAIAIYENQIERNVREGAQTGIYWKILAIRLADKGLDSDALDALERAIYYNSEEPILFYLTGVSAAKVAQKKIGFTANDREEKERYYQLSENAYLRALELDATYTKAMYGLAVLYAFELDRPQDAVVQLDRYLQIQKSDINAMFILARSYYMMRSFSSAIEVYERIVSRTKDQKIKEEAFKNMDIVRESRERMYE
jgi:tetratricopeptide (TPR) repeat protein